MATITGSIKYAPNRTLAGTDGIAGVAVVLQETNSGAALAVLTDASGNYSFTNVPAGDYQAVEYYGYTPSAATPGDFSAAVTADVITTGGVNPPVELVLAAPADATNLDGVSPTTMKFTVGTTDVIVPTIYNGPVKYTPIGAKLDSNITVQPENLFTGLDDGTFGNLPAGTPQGVLPSAMPPYSDIGSDFIYTPYDNSEDLIPQDGQYYIHNQIPPNYINTGRWWDLADHTTGNKTGRMMVVAGNNPGSSVLSNTVEVTQDTDYFFSAWVANLMMVSDRADPAFAIRILAEDNTELFYQQAGGDMTANIVEPTWVEFGNVFNSGDNSSVTVEIVSTGPAASGNDYAIDDIILREVTLNPLTPVKSVSSAIVDVGDTVTYTASIENIYDRDITSVTFQDTMPDGMTFVADSVEINGVTQPGINPETGFDLPDIANKETVTITFKAEATSVPAVNPAVNKAQFGYEYPLVEGNPPSPFTAETNGSEVTIYNSADVTTVKNSDKTEYLPGETVTYTITVSNAGPSAAKAPVITDTVPAAVQSPEYSIDGGASWQGWTGSVTLEDLPAGQDASVLIRGTLSGAVTSADSLSNTATAETSTPDENGSTNITTGTSTPTVIDTADVQTVKTTDKPEYTAGETITYTIAVTNNGPAAAKAPVVTDSIPAYILNQQYSIDEGLTWQNWTGSVTLGDIAAGSTVNVVIKGTVSEAAAGVTSLTNTASVVTDTPDETGERNITEYTVTVPLLWADLSIVKTVSHNPVIPGDIITFTLTVKNSGPDTAENPVVTDTVSPAVESPQFSIDGGTTWNPWTGSVTLASIPANGTAQILIQGTVAQNAAWPITNVAEITSEISDPDPSDNTGIVKVCGPRCRAAIDVVESVALQEAALSHILNAEGEKMQKMIASEGVTYCDLMKLNKKVRNLVNAATRLEMIMQGKLELLDGSCCDDC